MRIEENLECRFFGMCHGSSPPCWSKDDLFDLVAALFDLHFEHSIPSLPQICVTTLSFSSRDNLKIKGIRSKSHRVKCNKPILLNNKSQIIEDKLSDRIQAGEISKSQNYQQKQIRSPVNTVALQRLSTTPPQLSHTKAPRLLSSRSTQLNECHK